MGQHMSAEDNWVDHALLIPGASTTPANQLVEERVADVASDRCGQYRRDCIADLSGDPSFGAAPFEVVREGLNAGGFPMSDRTVDLQSVLMPFGVQRAALFGFEEFGADG